MERDPLQRTTSTLRRAARQHNGRARDRPPLVSQARFSPCPLPDGGEGDEQGEDGTLAVRLD